MNKINRTTFFSILLVLAYVLSACSGAPVAQSGNGDDQSSQSGQVQEVVFTGTVDSIGGGQWTVSGQAVNVDGTTSVDANIVVGDNVKVEARVGQDGSVTAVSIETSGADDANANSNGDNQNDSNANDNASNSNDNQNDNSNADNSNDDNANSNANSNGNSNDNSSADEQEVSGIVEAITTDSITINGVVYMLADFTEFKDLVTMGDQVKIHVIVNADGTITIREIEKSDDFGDDNSNSNDNGSDDNSNDDNGNDDNSNDDDDDNSNDDNGNDDDDDDDDDDDNDDDNSNSNGNG